MGDTMKELAQRVRSEVAKVVVGQDDAVDVLLVTLAVGGHALLEGVPGVAKTLLARTLAAALDLEFTRVQFTPDMLPSDITGTMALRGGNLVFRPGPVFTNVLLADEINRTPPKTQAALLEAMQEGQVSADDASHRLPEPFLVVATQNPIEYEGTYPLPEAQLDRFLVKIDITYPSHEHEEAMLRLLHRGVAPATLETVEQVAGPAEITSLRAQVDQTTVSDDLIGYISGIVRSTRTLPGVFLGASPRAAVHLLAASRAAARLAGRDYVIPDDVSWMALPVLSHRLLISPDAQLENYRPAAAVRSAVASVPVPR
jgi:MoxR-like ATPase